MTDVSIGKIERDLKDLWKQMAEGGQKEGQQAVLRACVLNLIVYAPGDASGNDVSQLLADVSEEHPSRMIIVLPRPDAKDPLLNSWVTALCHMSSGRKQVCCEQIVLRAEGDRLSQTPSLLRALLIPELPAVLWWRDQIPFEDELFQDLLNTADRVIIDSARLANPQQQLIPLAKLIADDRTAFSDLNWARLNSWRLLTARLYDVPDYRPYLARVNRIEIVGFDPARSSASTQALLLVGWIASRLKWVPASTPKFTGSTWEVELKTENRTVLIRIIAGEGKYAGITGIRLWSDGDPSAQFEISIASDGAHLDSSATVGGSRSAPYVTSYQGRNEAELLSNELEILGHDVLYEQALNFYANLSKDK